MKSRIAFIALIMLSIAVALASCVERQFDNPLDERNPATGGKPTGLKATVTGIGEVTLAWDPIESPLVDRWNVYRSMDGKKFDPISLQPTTTTNTYTDTGLANATTYYYMISADVGDKKQSDPISVTTFDRPDAPTGTGGSARSFYHGRHHRLAVLPDIRSIETGRWLGRRQGLPTLTQAWLTTLPTPTLSQPLLRVQRATRAVRLRLPPSTSPPA